MTGPFPECATCANHVSKSSDGPARAAQLCPVATRLWVWPCHGQSKNSGGAQ